MRNLIKEDFIHWGSVLFKVVREGLRAKFTHNRRLVQEKMLKDTGSRIIVDVSTEDKFWVTVKEEGEDFLGRLLMEVRDELVIPGHYTYTPLGDGLPPGETRDNFLRDLKASGGMKPSAGLKPGLSMEPSADPRPTAHLKPSAEPISSPVLKL